MIKTAQKKNFFGFTLIELLIVIAVLGILAAAVLVAVNPAKRTRQARDAARKNDVGSLATAIQSYYTTPGQGLYPGGLTSLTASGDVKQVPNDPTGGAYSYTLLANSSEAGVYDVLEDPTGASGSLWCWRSTNNLAQEVTAGGCTI